MKEFLTKYVCFDELSSHQEQECENFVFLRCALLELLNANKSDSSFNKFCEALFKQASVSKKFFKKYSRQWKPVIEDGLAGSETSALASLVLYIWLKKSKSLYKCDLGKKINILNTILVCIKQSTEEWATDNSKFYCDILKDLDNLTLTTIEHPQTKLIQTSSLPENLPASESQIIPLTILYSEGPIGRAYLETLRHMNLRPEKIIRMVPMQDRSSGKTLGRILFGKIRAAYCYQIEDFRINYWPRRIKRAHPELFEAISQVLSNRLNFPISVIENTTGNVHFESYAKSVDLLLIKNFNDDRLTTHLSENCKGNVLYTGGGIVPQKILNLKNIKMLHIHPGFLPDIRGADCSLWSNLVYGSPSVSAFYMAPKIDKGDVIFSTWVPKLEIKVAKDYAVDTLYRSIFSFIDPWIRSYALKLLLSGISKGTALSGHRQDDSTGTTYYFMSAKVREKALKKYFVKHQSLR